MAKNFQGILNFSLLTTKWLLLVTLANISTVLKICAQGTITGFNLINATTDQVIQSLPSGTTLNLATLSSQNLNIQAVPSATGVGSVKFTLSGAQSRSYTDKAGPVYALFGDKNGNYSNWTPTIGDYILTAQPYAGTNPSSNAGTPVTITFKVINQPQQYILDITSNGSGTVAKSPDQLIYNSGSNVIITAIPDAGNVFDHWSENNIDIGSTNPLAVNMSSDKYITANFSPSAIQHTLNTSTAGGGTVSKSPDLENYPINSVVSLTATPDNGNIFSGWSGDATGTTNPLTVTLDGNKNITATFIPLPNTAYCNQTNNDNIGCFTSVRPIGQTQIITYPATTHTFQLLAKNGVTPYTDGSGTLESNADFTGYIPINGSSKRGYLALNHEKTTGAMSVLDIGFNETTMLWSINTNRKINFAPVVRTERNCSGTVTPWGTVISSEETTTTGDSDKDGYLDVGWQVEVDPATGLIRDYNNDGKRDKLWALGRFYHENIAIASNRTVASAS